MLPAWVRRHPALTHQREKIEGAAGHWPWAGCSSLVGAPLPVGPTMQRTRWALPWAAPALCPPRGPAALPRPDLPRSRGRCDHGQLQYPGPDPPPFRVYKGKRYFLEGLGSPQGRKMPRRSGQGGYRNRERSWEGGRRAGSRPDHLPPPLLPSSAFLIPQLPASRFQSGSEEVRSHA